MGKKLLLFVLALSLCSCDHVSRSTKHSESAYSMVESESDYESEESTDASSTAEDHKVYEASDVAEYFNAKGEAEGIAVIYVEEEGYWYLHHMGEESTDTSKDNLSSGISAFLKYIPLYRVYEGGYLFRYLSEYIEDLETYFIYVAASSNWFAAVSIYSYIEDNRLITDVIIYDGRNCLYA